MTWQAVSRLPDDTSVCPAAHASSSTKQQAQGPDGALGEGACPNRRV